MPAIERQALRSQALGLMVAVRVSILRLSNFSILISCDHQATVDTKHLQGGQEPPAGFLALPSATSMVLARCPSMSITRIAFHLMLLNIGLDPPLQNCCRT